jgi:tRNA threonylcarbamoyladenosine biosynthesis protein TsaE
LTSVTVETVGAEATAQVLAVVHEAFGARPVLDPPAAATHETAETLRARLESGGGLLARLDGRPVGALVLDREAGSVHLRRFGVVPAAQGHGVARLLVDAAARRAAELGCTSLTVTAREELPATVRFWTAQGFVEVGRTAPDVELRRPVHGGTFHAADGWRGRFGPVTSSCSPGRWGPARPPSPKVSAPGSASAGP